MNPSDPTDALLGHTVRSDSGNTEYLFESKLGMGGTAAAYLVRRIERSGSSPAVIKIILPEIVEGHGATAQAVFLKEAVALGRLNERAPPSPFVVRLLDVGTISFRWQTGTLMLPWLAIEYVNGGTEGTTLRDRVERTRRLTGFAFDRERAARALLHITSGLEEVHAVGVVHRDLTPGNVLCCNVGSEEIFKLSDFGIARPSGIAMTFGAAIVGTPGYMAPEQIAEAKASVASDIFSLACVTYFVLTGEEYIKASNALETLARITTGKRSKLANAQMLCPELRQDQRALALLEDILIRATAVDPAQRPTSVQAFAAAVIPCLRENAGTGSERYRSALRTQASHGLPTMNWVVRHSPGDDLAIESTGWDGDGRCLAVTSHGLRFWDGCSWSIAPLEGVPQSVRPRFVSRVAAGRWLSGGDHATLFEYARGGVSRIVRGRRPEVTFLNAAGTLDELAVVVGQAHGSPPMLFGLVGRCWLKALPLPWAAVIASLTQLDDEHWLVCGRRTDGRGFVAVYQPLEWQIDELDSANSRAYLCCAVQREREIAIAVGAEGAIVRLERGRSISHVLEGRPNLACAAIDVFDREWAGALGELWASNGGGAWSRVWYDPNWTRPFVSIHADVGSIIAMTADGGVLECQASLSRIQRS
ncbi:MAG TPA: serine/threonine-protein kinase [Polyangiaceae bacterium]